MKGTRLRSRFQGCTFTVKDFEVNGSAFKSQDLGFRNEGLGFRVDGLGTRV